jgi:hypothetical protein
LGVIHLLGNGTEANEQFEATGVVGLHEPRLWPGLVWVRSVALRVGSGERAEFSEQRSCSQAC